MQLHSLFSVVALNVSSTELIRAVLQCCIETNTPCMVGHIHKLCICTRSSTCRTVCVCEACDALGPGSSWEHVSRLLCLWPLAALRLYCDDNEEQLAVELDVDFFLLDSFVLWWFFSHGSSARII